MRTRGMRARLILNPLKHRKKVTCGTVAPKMGNLRRVNPTSRAIGRAVAGPDAVQNKTGIKSASAPLPLMAHAGCAWKTDSVWAKRGNDHAHARLARPGCRDRH